MEQFITSSKIFKPEYSINNTIKLTKEEEKGLSEEEKDQLFLTKTIEN